MKNKEETIADLLSSDEGRQRLAHAMIGSKEPFVYRPSPPGHSERAQASYLRHMADQQALPSLAEFYRNMADEWDKEAEVIEASSKTK
jgi:hypothetical protein